MFNATNKDSEQEIKYLTQSSFTSNSVMVCDKQTHEVYIWSISVRNSIGWSKPSAYSSQMCLHGMCHLSFVLFLRTYYTICF